MLRLQCPPGATGLGDGSCTQTLLQTWGQEKGFGSISGRGGVVLVRLQKERIPRSDNCADSGVTYLTPPFWKGWNRRGVGSGDDQPVRGWRPEVEGPAAVTQPALAAIQGFHATERPAAGSGR